MAGLQDFFSGIFGFFRSTKATYEAGTRFTRMRVWIIALLTTDVIATIAWVFFSVGTPMGIVVWFQPGFPANMLVVKYDGSEPLKDVTLVLDERYSLFVDRIEKGPNGFELNNLFRDNFDQRPPDGYRPGQLRIKLQGSVMSFKVGLAQGPGSG